LPERQEHVEIADAPAPRVDGLAERSGTGLDAARHRPVDVLHRHLPARREVLSPMTGRLDDPIGMPLLASCM
jgi:hypothetical protein